MRRLIQMLMFALLLAGTSGVVFAQSPGVDAAWARQTPPGAKVGGAFMILVGGKTADRLLAARSPAAGVVELHTHRMDDGVARMRRIPAIDVPANGQVELKPGGLHLMLIDLKAPLKAGDLLPLTLQFEKAGPVEVKLVVRLHAPDANLDRDDHRSHQPHKH